MRAHPFIRAAHRRRRNDDGYVLATVVAMSFVVIMTVTAIFTVALVNITGTRRAAGQAEGRSAAESALDRVFSTTDTATGFTDPAGLVAATAPAASWSWYGQASNGKYSLCTSGNGFTIASQCVHLARSSGGDRANDFAVEVTARSRCQSGTLDATTGAVTGGTGCIVTRYQQRMRKKQFFDYLSFTDSEFIPLNLRGEVGIAQIRVPYSGFSATSRDVMDGPVRTNDTNIAVCSKNQAVGWAPVFLQGVFASASNAAFVSSVGCNAAVASADANTVNPVAIAAPTVVQKMDLPAGTTKLKDIGLNVVTNAITLCAGGYVSGTLAGSCATPTPYPESRVLYVSPQDSGSYVQVTGLYAGKLTLATPTNVDIEIVGDLKRSDPADSAAVLGLVAGDDIVVRCYANSRGTLDTIARMNNGQDAGNPCDSALVGGQQVRTIEAALLALNTIYVDRWGTGGLLPSGSLPTLNIYGTMASKYRGVFGAYDSYNDTYTRGYVKSFKFNAALMNAQPPYFLEPTNANWERVDLTEVTPCGPGLFNETPKGAGC